MLRQHLQPCSRGGSAYRARDGTARFGGSSHTGMLQAFRPSIVLTVSPVQVASICPASFAGIRVAQVAAVSGPSRNARASWCSVWWRQRWPTPALRRSQRRYAACNMPAHDGQCGATTEDDSPCLIIETLHAASIVRSHIVAPWTSWGASRVVYRRA